MAYSDDDLKAFIDGTASDELSQRIAVDLATDRALEDRVMALDPGIGAAAPAFAELKGPAKDAVKLPDPAKSETQPGFIRKLLPLVAAGLVGAFLASGFLEPPEDTTDWRVQVANYQALYSLDTVLDAPFSAEELAEQTALASDRIGLSDLATALAEAEGLTHVRTQTLQVNGTPLAQVVFKTADGVPVALCGIASENSAASNEIGVGRMSKMKSAAFETAGHSWLLIGGKDADLIIENAKLFRDALNALPTG